VIGIEEIGRHGEATNRALLVAMENIACTYSANVGYGAKEVETKHRAWILLDWKIKVLKRPSYNERVEIITWSTDIDKLFAFRDYEIRYESGELLAIGTSRWIFMDTEKKRPVRITEDVAALYESEPNQHVFTEKDRELLSEIDESKLKTAETYTYRLRRSDIDMNNHMHNINYLDMAYEILPQKIYDTVEFNTIRIQYKKQILPDTLVNCKYYQEGKTHFVVAVSEEGIHAIIALTEKEAADML